MNNVIRFLVSFILFAGLASMGAEATILSFILFLILLSSLIAYSGEINGRDSYKHQEFSKKMTIMAASLSLATGIACFHHSGLLDKCLKTVSSK